MSSFNDQRSEATEVARELWRRQRAQLEQELLADAPLSDNLDVAATTNTALSGSSAASESAATDRHLQASVQPTDEELPILRAQLKAARAEREQLRQAVQQRVGSAWNELEIAKAQHLEFLRQADETAQQQRLQEQQRCEQELARQREIFHHDLARQRADFEQELARAEAEWSTRRDQEWNGVRHAKEVHDIAAQRMKEDLASQRVREREELLNWRRQAEAELADIRQLLDSERLQQQAEFSRYRDGEGRRLRSDREEFEGHVRKVQAELNDARQQLDEDLQQAREAQATGLLAERTEFNRQRDAWTDKFRREQVVLENGLQFLDQHLSRVSDELRTAQRGLEAVTASAEQSARPLARFPTLNPVTEHSQLSHQTSDMTASESTKGTQTMATHTLSSDSAMPLSLDEIRERLVLLKRPERHESAA